KCQARTELAGKRTGKRIGSRCQPARQSPVSAVVSPLPLSHRVSRSRCPLVACGFSFVTTRPHLRFLCWWSRNGQRDGSSVGAGAGTDKVIERDHQQTEGGEREASAWENSDEQRERISQREWRPSAAA